MNVKNSKHPLKPFKNLSRYYFVMDKRCMHMRQCEIKDIKLYQVRTKIIALGWYWVTMIFFGQINPKIHYSPGMNSVQVKTKKLSCKSMKASWKWTIFGSFLVQFLWIPCFWSQISLKNKLQAHTLHTFLISSAFQLCYATGHFWHLHIPYRVNVKNQKSCPSSW